MGVYICNGYGPTKEMFSFILLNAPNFEHTLSKPSLDECFDDLRQGISQFGATLKTAQGKETIEACLKTVQDCYIAYKTGNTKLGISLIQSAKVQFVEAKHCR